MKNPLLICALLFVAGFVMINGFNNILPKLSLLVLFIVYICIPAYIKAHNIISKYLQVRKHPDTNAWA